MKNLKCNVACAGMDVHYKFSNVTFRAVMSAWRLKELRRLVRNRKHR